MPRLNKLFKVQGVSTNISLHILSSPIKKLPENKVMRGSFIPPSRMDDVYVHP